jgi:hypothetical protein
MRRVYLRGHTNIRKRLLIHAGGFNLGRLMRTLFGVGTPRSLQGRAAAILAFVCSVIRSPERLWDAIWTTYRPSTSLGDLLGHRQGRPLIPSAESDFTTGC